MNNMIMVNDMSTSGGSGVGMGMLVLLFLLFSSAFFIAWYVGRFPKERTASIIGIPIIPLVDAKLCLDCETVFDSNRSQCSKCGSPQFFPLLSWLGSIQTSNRMHRTIDGDWKYDHIPISLPVKVRRILLFTTA